MTENDPTLAQNETSTKKSAQAQVTSTSEDRKLIQAPTPFPDSQLWELQRQYFRHQGINAWEKEVPCYITSNAYIGRLYAEQCLAFISDWCDAHPEDSPEFTVLEIASGTGQFAFYFLIAFEHLLKTLQLKNIRLQFVMTDLAEKNVQFYEKNPVFEPFIASDQLDFGVFNTETDEDVLLRRRQKMLSSCLSSTPLILISNYALDFIRQDAIRFDNGKVENAFIELKSRYNDFDTEKVAHLNELNLSYSFKTIDPQHYYDDPALNNLLEQYDVAFKTPDESDQKGDLKAPKPERKATTSMISVLAKKTSETKTESLPKKALVFIPLGAIELFNTLDKLTKGRYFALVADKGDTTIDEIKNYIQDKYSTFHGVYTFSVNFHALETYLKQKGADAFLASGDIVFKVNLFFKGISREALTKSTFVYHDRMEHFTPTQYVSWHDDVFAYCYRFGFDTIMGFLRLSEWDPIAYMAIHMRLMDLIPTLPNLTYKKILQQLYRVESRLYPIKSNESAYLLLGVIYDTLNEPERAIQLYLRALTFFEKSKSITHNLAVLYDKQKNSAKAIVYYERALALDHRDQYARRRLEFLAGKITVFTFVPYLKALIVLACLGASFYLLTK